MPLSIAQVLKASTEKQILLFLLDALQSLGFKTTSWQEGSVQRNILTAFARNGSGVTTVIQQIVSNFLVSPKGDWLDIVGTYRFGIPRLEAVSCERFITLISAPSAPPHVITEGSVVVTTSGTPLRYKIVGGPYDLATGQTRNDIMVKAEFAGIAWNVPVSTPVAFQTPTYTGVTVTFGELDPVIPGVDREGDERYFLRCSLRWAELTFSVGLRAYELWALTAAPSIKRARAINNYPFENDVTIALDPGLASEVTQVQNYVSTRNPPNDVVTVQAANVINQSIVYAPRVVSGTTVAELNAALQAVLDAMPIGGIEVQGAIAGRLLRDTLVEALLCNATLGVKTVGLTVPATDIILGATDIVIGNFTVTPEFIY